MPFLSRRGPSLSEAGGLPHRLPARGTRIGSPVMTNLRVNQLFERGLYGQELPHSDSALELLASKPPRAFAVMREME
jgi:hypothetical protein